MGASSSSSRGRVRSAASSWRPVWLSARAPERLSTSAIRRRTTGTRATVPSDSSVIRPRKTWIRASASPVEPGAITVTQS